MATVEAEHHRFLEHLVATGAPVDVQRLAEIVHQHIEVLVDLGTAKSARSARLAPLALDGLAEPVETKPAAGAQVGVSQQAFRLASLKVGPFRGFMTPEVFDLSRDITLVYGPNGSGKTSFCEALEYSMLGTVGEARAKRIDQKAYCNNARAKKHNQPELSGCTADGAPFRIKPNESDFRFAFIEKNRLDDFARIAAKTPGDQKLLIATLFGIEGFANFVRGFNSDLSKVLVLEGPKAKELEERKKSVAAATTVVQQFESKRLILEEDRRRAAAEFDEQKTFKALREWLCGIEGGPPGRLAEVKALLDKPQASITDLTAAALQEQIDGVKRLGAEVNTIRAKLQEKATEVSFKDLYTAVAALSEGATECPACRTPIGKVTEDPFVRAKAGISQLKDLADLQGTAKALKERLADRVSQLLLAMRTAVAAVVKLAPAEELSEAQLPELPIEASGKWMTAWVANDDKALNALVRLLAHVELADRNARNLAAQRTKLMQERARLENLQQSFDRLEGQANQLEKDFAVAKKSIADFDEQNQKLLDDVQAEKLVLAC